MARIERQKPSVERHWKTLQLDPGAPECVIKAARLFLIELHHPDRGGDVRTAQRINAAYDELTGRGTPANEHVARYYNGEPWHVLGVMASAAKELAVRAGAALTKDLKAHPRLAARVKWAVEGFGSPARSPTPRVLVTSTGPARPRERREPATPGRPAGLPESVQFGTLEWQADATRDVRITWERNAPYKIDVSAKSPIIASVKASKAVPGRFVITLSVDWDVPELRATPGARGYTLTTPVGVRWPGGDAVIKVTGVLTYPAELTAAPQELDFGTVRLNRAATATLVLRSTAATTATIDASAWIARIDGAGSATDGPLRLQAGAPVRVVFGIRWPPIVERLGGAAPGRSVRPTGKITVRWNDRELEVPATVIVTR